MRKWMSVLAVFVATLVVVTGAFAQTGSYGGASAPGGGSGTPGSAASGGSDKSKVESPAVSPATGAASTTASADFSARHRMEGEVTKVDAKKGHLTLKTAEGKLGLHFPPSALQNVKKGDRVSVELAMKSMGQASSKMDKKDKGAASPATEQKGDKKE